jgi:hypothetical protein
LFYNFPHNRKTIKGNPNTLTCDSMIQTSPKSRLATICIVAWIIINILLMVLILLGGDSADLNNWIEIGLWVIAIPALLSMKKWGLAFVLFVLIYTLSTSMGIIIYYQVWLNAIRVIINGAAIVYLFNDIFRGNFKN